MKTRRVGSTGRFGARYGLKIRKKVLEIEKKQRQKQICPRCKRKTIKRLSTGIFKCKKCNYHFTGKAYYVI